MVEKYFNTTSFKGCLCVDFLSEAWQAINMDV